MTLHQPANMSTHIVSRWSICTDSRHVKRVPTYHWDALLICGQ